MPLRPNRQLDQIFNTSHASNLLRVLNCCNPPPHRRPGFRSPGHLSQRRRPRGCLDPDLHPEAPLRALARGPGPSRTAPRPRARPRAPLGAGEGCRQAPLALVPGDRPPEDFQDHGRHRHQRPPPQPCPKNLRHGFGIAAVAPGVPACRSRRSRPPWATPTCRPQRSTPLSRASRRGIFWPGCGNGRGIPGNWASEGLWRRPIARMTWTGTRKLRLSCDGVDAPD